MTNCQNTITPFTASSSTFAEFLARPERAKEIEYYHNALGDSGIQFPGEARELIDTIGWPGISDDDLCDRLEELAGLFTSAGTIFAKMAEAFAAQAMPTAEDLNEGETA